MWNYATFAKEFKGYHKSYYSEGFHLEGEMQEEEEMIKALNPAAFLIAPASQSLDLTPLMLTYQPVQLRKRPEKTGNNFWEGNNSPFKNIPGLKVIPIIPCLTKNLVVFHPY